VEWLQLFRRKRFGHASKLFWGHEGFFSRRHASGRGPSIGPARWPPAPERLTVKMQNRARQRGPFTNKAGRHCLRRLWGTFFFFLISRDGLGPGRHILRCRGILRRRKKQGSRPAKRWGDRPRSLTPQKSRKCVMIDWNRLRTIDSRGRPPTGRPNSNHDT